MQFDPDDKATEERRELRKIGIDPDSVTFSKRQIIIVGIVVAILIAILIFK
jgi:hypothetical protein